MFDKSIIINYIKKIRKEDIFNFSIHEGINISDHDVDIIYDYIKNRYIDIFENVNNIFIEIKDKLEKNTYNKIIELYNKYKYIIKK